MKDILKSLLPVAERIKEERIRLGKSQAEVAALCACVRETWGKYERGVFDMNTETLRAFAALGADMLYILTGQRSQAVAHMKPGVEGEEAALLRHWHALPPPLRARVNDLAEVLANLHKQQGAKR